MSVSKKFSFEDHNLALISQLNVLVPRVLVRLTTPIFVGIFQQRRLEFSRQREYFEGENVHWCFPVYQR